MALTSGDGYAHPRARDHPRSKDDVDIATLLAKR